eukprot:scaffold51031_cov63-Attheya_sp.AAC.5
MAPLMPPSTKVGMKADGAIVSFSFKQGLNTLQASWPPTASLPDPPQGNRDRGGGMGDYYTSRYYAPKVWWWWDLSNNGRNTLMILGVDRSDLFAVFGSIY